MNTVALSYITYLYTTHYVSVIHLVTVPLSYNSELYYHLRVEFASVVQICVRKSRQACAATSLVCSIVEVVGVFRSTSCQGGTVLWTVRL